MNAILEKLGPFKLSLIALNKYAYLVILVLLFCNTTCKGEIAIVCINGHCSQHDHFIRSFYSVAINPITEFKKILVQVVMG